MINQVPHFARARRHYAPLARLNSLGQRQFSGLPWQGSGAPILDHVIPYGRQSISAEDIQAVTRVLQSDWLTTGPAVEEFETALQKHTGGIPAVAVSSGTSALHTAYAAAGIGPGDEVITPPITFVATQAALVHLGAIPVFADVDADTATISPESVQRAITNNTKAVVCVDYAGHPANLERLREVTEASGLILIEDAAHSLGSSLNGRPVGSLADITTLSFFPTKNITTGEGGAVVSPNPTLLERAKRLSRQGLVRDSARLADEGPWHQEVPEFGFNYRLSDILAALGVQQLRRLSEFKSRRAEIKARYDAALSSIPGVLVPYQDPRADVMWHLYPLRVPVSQRRQLFEWLRLEGVGVQVNYLPAYRHPAFKKILHSPPDCPMSEQFYAREISLPMFPGLSNDQVDYVAMKVRHYLTEK
jgi:dTDP-4-amino-4,6-dideoxygalactose transaminase